MSASRTCYDSWAPPHRLPNPTVRSISWLVHEAPHRILSALRDRRPAKIIVTVLLAGFATLALLAARAEWILLEVDLPVQETAIGARSPWLNDAMAALTVLGTRWVIGALTLLIAIWALATGRCRYAAGVLVVAVMLNPAIEISLKELIGRARPDLARLLPGRGPSFPSGHVLASVGFYGLIPFLAWESTARYWIRRVAFFGAFAVIMSVSVSRVYLDVHWASDVVGGLMLGTVIVAASYRALRGHRMHRDPGCCSLRPDSPGRPSDLTPAARGESPSEDETRMVAAFERVQYGGADREATLEDCDLAGDPGPTA